MDPPNSQFNDVTASALEWFNVKHEARELALKSSREIIRRSANAIRAIHRKEMDKADGMTSETEVIVAGIQERLKDHPDLYFTGFVQDAMKEHAEACIFYSFISGQSVPTHHKLGLEMAAYLNGFAEAASELRRYILDSLRQGDDERCEELMVKMDDVYTTLVVMDFPDALTGGLRRTTDALRAVLERTRGDLTLTMRQRRLEEILTKQGGK